MSIPTACAEQLGALERRCHVTATKQSRASDGLHLGRAYPWTLVGADLCLVGRSPKEHEYLSQVGTRRYSTGSQLGLDSKEHGTPPDWIPIDTGIKPGEGEGPPGVKTPLSA